MEKGGERREMSSKKRLGRAMQLCHVWSHSRRLPSPPPLTRHLHLRAWQQRRGGEGCGSGSFLGLCGSDRRKKKKRKKIGRKDKKKGGGYKTEGKRRVILWATAFRMTGLSWEISVKRARELFFLFPPLQRYLLWHIAVLCYRKSADIWSCIFLRVGSVIGSSETNLCRWLMLAPMASVLFLAEFKLRRQKGRKSPRLYRVCRGKKIGARRCHNTERVVDYYYYYFFF